MESAGRDLFLGVRATFWTSDSLCQLAFIVTPTCYQMLDCPLAWLWIQVVVLEIIGDVGEDQGVLSGHLIEVNLINGS